MISLQISTRATAWRRFGQLSSRSPVAQVIRRERIGDLQPTLRLASARGAQMAHATAAAPELPARDRPLGEMAVLIALFGLLAGLGFFLALVTRERPERKEAAALATPLSAAPGGNSASD